MDKYRDIEGEIERKSLPKLEEQLKPEQRGRKMGMEETPKSDSKSQSAYENRIRSEHERVAARAHGHYSEIIQPLRAARLEVIQRIMDPPLGEPLSKARQAAVEAKKKYDMDATKSSRDKEIASKGLASLVDEGVNTAEARGKNAIYYIYACIAAYLVIESLLNSHFLGQGNISGLVGGFIEATSISLLSIFTSFYIGRMIRYVYDIDWWGRKVSWGISLLYMAGIGTYHNIIGWYRHCLVYQNAETAQFDAIAEFAKNGIWLPEIYSYGLMMVGLFFALITFYHGISYKAAQQSTKHGKIVSIYDAACTKLNSVYQEYMSNVSTAYTEQLGAIDDVVRSVTEDISKLNLNIIETQSIMDKDWGLMNAIRSSYTNVIGKFRKSNEAVRRTPTPLYFSEEAKELGIKSFAEIGEDLEMAKEIINNVKDIRSQIQEKANIEKTNIRVDHKATLELAPIPGYTV